MPPEPLLKRVIRLLSSLAMVGVGILHFVRPEGFVKIVPAFLPAPLFLVYLSGFFEIAGGLGVLLERTRRLAGLGLVALYVAVFPANINMAVNDIQPADGHIPIAALWLRLPFQILFIAVAWWLSRPSPAKAPPAP